MQPSGARNNVEEDTMNESLKMRYIVIAALVVLVGFALPVLAQEETEAPEEPAQTEEEKAIEEAL